MAGHRMPLVLCRMWVMVCLGQLSIIILTLLLQPQFDEHSLNNRNNDLSSILSVDNASSLAATAPVSCTSVYTGQAHSSSVYLGMHGYTQPTVIGLAL